MYNSYIWAYMVGCIIAGLLFELHIRYTKLFLLMAIVVVVLGSMGVLFPLANDFYLLGIAVAFVGIIIGFLETGVTTICLDKFSDDCTSSIMIIYFFHSIGFLVGPIIYYSIPAGFHQNRTNQHILTWGVFGGVGAVTLIISLLWFMAFFISRNINCPRFVNRKTDNSRTSQNLQNTPNPEKSHNSGVMRALSANILTGLLIIVTSAVSKAYPNILIMQQKSLELSTSKVTSVSLMYWGCFAVSRAVALILMQKCTPVQMIVLCIFLVFAAGVIMNLEYHFDSAYILWCSGLLAVGTAPFLPIYLIWLNSYFPISGKVTAFLLFLEMLGGWISPIIMNHFIASPNDINAIYYMIVISSILCILITPVLGLCVFRSRIQTELSRPQPESSEDHASQNHQPKPDGKKSDGNFDEKKEVSLESVKENLKQTMKETEKDLQSLEYTVRDVASSR